MDGNSGVKQFYMKIPKGFPAPIIPEDNQLTIARVELGKRLFFDPILSRDFSISCATCHHPEKSFSDTVALSKGVFGRKGLRNSPSLANIAYKNQFFMDGGVPTLELQVTAPIQDHNEMDLNILDVVQRLKSEPDYVKLSKKAYNQEPSPYVVTRSIASYERTLISGNSNYDQYRNGNEMALTHSQKRGMGLFYSTRTNCSSCHSGFNFTTNNFENIGLYSVYKDSGRMRVTLNEVDRGKFIVPSLRNVAVTAPYMHDGSMESLEEVIDFFNDGGEIHTNKNNLVKSLRLTDEEKNDLVNFLKSLTDKEFLINNNPKK